VPVANDIRALANTATPARRKRRRCFDPHRHEWPGEEAVTHDHHEARARSRADPTSTARDDAWKTEDAPSLPPAMGPGPGDGQPSRPQPGPMGGRRRGPATPHLDPRADQHPPIWKDVSSPQDPPRECGHGGDARLRSPPLAPFPPLDPFHPPVTPAPHSGPARQPPVLRAPAAVWHGGPRPAPWLHPVPLPARWRPEVFGQPSLSPRNTTITPRNPTITPRFRKDLAPFARRCAPRGECPAARHLCPPHRRGGRPWAMILVRSS